jgi:hypothetical protein
MKGFKGCTGFAESERARRTMFGATVNILKNVTNVGGRIYGEIKRGSDKIDGGVMAKSAVNITKNVLKNVMALTETIMRDTNRALDKIQDIGAGEYAEPPPMWTDAEDYPEDDCDIVALVDGKMVLGVYVMGSFMTRRGETIAPSHYFIIPAEGDV